MMPEIKWKKIEGASEYVPFRIEPHIIYTGCSGQYDGYLVTNTEMSFVCEEIEEAEWLMSQLNRED